jgi:hypothetical protein
MAEHAVGGQVVMCGTILAIEGNIALVLVDKSFPDGGTVTVRLGRLRDDGESDEDAIREITRAGMENPGRTAMIGADGDVTLREPMGDL